MFNQTRSPKNEKHKRKTETNKINIIFNIVCYLHMVDNSQKLVRSLCEKKKKKEKWMGHKSV